MKEIFFGYYPPEDDEINEIWKDSIIAFDANTLLNLYRYTKGTREDFLKILKVYSDRLWLPYQAGYEFHSNRISVIKSQEYAYREIGKELDDELNSLNDKLNKFKRHPFIKPSTIIKQISDRFNKIKSDLEKQSQKHPEYLKSDLILPEVTNLFNGKVGEIFSEEELNKIYQEGEKRYDKNIPPGFSDRANKKKKGDRNLFGDLIIWKQLISHSKKSNKTIIFITDDRKEDWWLKFKGETIRPREELIKEFYDETGYRILIYQADNFLRFANDKLKDTIKEKSIEEVTEVRIEDESKYVSLYNLQSDFGLNNNDLLNFNKNDGTYINPLSSSAMEILKSTTDAFHSLGENPSWMKNIESISKIAEQPSWLKSAESMSKLTQVPAWFEKVESISKLTQAPKLMDDIDKLSKLTQTPPWMDKIDKLSKLTQAPPWVEKTNTPSFVDLSDDTEGKDDDQ